MVQVGTSSGQKLMFAANIGNGSVDGISSETKGNVVSYEPVIAPKADKRALRTEDEKPDISLRVDNQVLVFGADDVFQHGVRDAIRRLNSTERYTHPDYFRLFYALLLKLFSAYRGASQFIAPTGVISIPVEQYNNPDVVREIYNTLPGDHRLMDYENCELRLRIEGERLRIVPEGYGAFMHNIYDPATLKKREGAKTGGVTVVVDIGYETVNLVFFEGLKYQPAISRTIPRAGMGVVAREIVEQSRASGISVDVNRVDRGMRALARLPIGAEKQLEIVPGLSVDVTEVYDRAIANRAQHIAQEISTLTENIALSRVLVVGGGAYHLTEPLATLWGTEIPASIDPQQGEALGLYTMLKLQFAAKSI